MHKATLWKSLKNDIVECRACRQFCKIAPGHTGLCGVRQNVKGDLFLLVYGNAVSANLDPIEKKPLYHFLPNSEIFSIGTLGCNFACSFCQNWNISQASKEIKQKLQKHDNLDDLELEITKFGYELPPEKIVSYCLENDIPSIAYTYNEPSVFFEYAYDTAKLAHENDLKNVYVSNGYASEEAVDKMALYLDAINIDLKAFTDDFYMKICKSKLQPVLDSIKYHYEKGIWLEITTLVIPGQNDSESELRDIAEFIVSVSEEIPWHISRFRAAYEMDDVESTPMSTLQKAYDIGKDAGLKYVYVGNIAGDKLQNTKCPNCDAVLVGRSFYGASIRNLDLKKGECRSCSEKIAGVWS